MVPQTLGNAVLLRKQVLLVPVSSSFSQVIYVVTFTSLMACFLLNSKGADIEMCVIGLKLKSLSFKC